MNSQKLILLLIILVAILSSCSGKKKEITDSDENIIAASERKVADSSVNKEENNQTSPLENRDLIAHILQKHKGKVIYLDIWATWCGPCLACMQSSESLQKEFKDKDVRFVYFCVKSKKEDWQAKIDECKIKGDHYLLSDPEYDALNKKLDINGIPRYLLIDKKGEIVNKKALSPGLGGHVDQNLIREINELIDK